MAVIGAGLLGVDAGLSALGVGSGSTPGHTVFELSEADVIVLRELQTAAAARIAEMRQELEAAEAELAVLDEALAEIDEAPEEAPPDGG